MYSGLDPPTRRRWRLLAATTASAGSCVSRNGCFCEAEPKKGNIGARNSGRWEVGIRHTRDRPARTAALFPQGWGLNTRLRG